MDDNLPLMAATEWAQLNKASITDPIEFGAKVAQVYLACQAAQHHAGDERATAAALAALSVRPEILQAIGLLSSLCPSPQGLGRSTETNWDGAL